MKLEKSKNAKRNIIYGFINKFITMLLPFVIRSVIIYKLSAAYLGLNSLFSSILQVLNLTELGFSNAVVFSMYKPIAENDTRSICALLNFYRKVYRVIGIIILFIGLSLMPFLDKLISGSYPQGINIYVLYLCYLGNTVLSYLLFAYKNALLNAHQRTDIISNINTISLGGMYLVQIIVLFITKNYYLYVVMMPFFTIINNLLIAIISKRKYPAYYCNGNVSKKQISNIKKQVAGLLVTKICTVSRNSFDSIFVSAFLGLTITAVYGNYYYIMNAIIAILTVVSNGMLAGVGNGIVTETKEKNYQDLRKINFVYMWFSGWCTICLLCLYQPFMEVWVGNDLMFPFGIVILFCIYFYSLEMGVVRSIYSDGAGLWWENRYRAVFEAICNVILNYILGKYFGVYGIIIATLFSILVVNFGFGSQIVFKYYFKNGKIRQYFTDHGKYAMITCFIAFITYSFCNRLIIAKGIVALMVRFLICLFIPNILYIILYYKTKMFKISIPWLMNIFHLQKLVPILFRNRK